jgi:hypothetical protein
MKRALSVLALSLAAAGCAQMESMMGGGGSWKSLFDGSNLNAFDRVGDANWRVQDGAAVADKGTGFLLTKETYGDFELKAEFYAESDTNSGIFIRCSERVTIDSKNCYEVNIWDDRPVKKYGTGAIVDTGPGVPEPFPKAGGKWNTYEISAKGDHLVVKLNGKQTVDVHDAKHAKGPIGLQYAPGNKKDSGLPIKYRKVEIKPL